MLKNKPRPHLIAVDDAKKQEFLARWPTAACKMEEYTPGLSVQVLRLEDGTVVAVGAPNSDIWASGLRQMLNRKRASNVVPMRSGKKPPTTDRSQAVAIA